MPDDRKATLFHNISSNSKYEKVQGILPSILKFAVLLKTPFKIGSDFRDWFRPGSFVEQVLVMQYTTEGDSQQEIENQNKYGVYHKN